MGWKYAMYRYVLLFKRFEGEKIEFEMVSNNGVKV